MKLLSKLNEFIRCPIWFILLIAIFIYLIFANKHDISKISNWISLTVSIVTVIISALSIHLYKSVNDYKKEVLRKITCSVAINRLRKILKSVKNDYKSKRQPEGYLKRTQFYINKLAENEQLLEAFGNNYQCVMDIDELNLANSNHFIDAVDFIIEIYNESEKL